MNEFLDAATFFVNLLLNTANPVLQGIQERAIWNLMGNGTSLPPRADTVLKTKTK